MTISDDRARAALTGALVGDAAAMGFHWLYDQERIAELAGDAPEFRAPNAADYQGPDGGLGYFAHGGKRAGEPSHYGAQMLAMATAISREGGYSAESYAASFRDWFGYGGRWTGYIDRPTRATLDAMARAEAAEAPITRCGADDAQLPAISKLPALVARHFSDGDLMDKVESAVRLTNDRDDSVAWGRAFAAMLRAAIRGEAREDVVRAAYGDDAGIDRQIDAALDMGDATTAEVATAHALHCQLQVAFPVLVHAIATAASYRDGIRANILAGGDNCGRAIPIGAVLGAVFADDTARGIPGEWRARVDVPGDLAALF